MSRSVSEYAVNAFTEALVRFIRDIRTDFVLNARKRQREIRRELETQRRLPDMGEREVV